MTGLIEQAKNLRQKEEISIVTEMTVPTEKVAETSKKANSETEEPKTDNSETVVRTVENNTAKNIVSETNKEIQECSDIEKTAKEILEVKGSDIEVKIQLGKIFKDFKDNHTEDELKNLLKHKDVNMKLSQAKKCIRLYKYCNKDVNRQLTTETHARVGIEKIIKITNLKDEEKQAELELFVSKKIISVVELGKTVKILNKNTYDFDTALKMAQTQLEQENQNKNNSTKNNINWENKCKELEERVKDLEQKLQKYEAKIRQDNTHIIANTSNDVQGVA